MARFPFLFLISFITTLSYSQDLSGTWEGTSTNAANHVRLIIIRQGDDYVGYTHDYGSGFCKANFIGYFNTDKQQLNGKCVSFIEASISHSLMKLRLNYEKYEDGDYLRGISTANSLLGSLFMLASPDQVVLKRVSKRVDTTSFMRRFLRNQATPEVDDTVTNDPPPVKGKEKAVDTAKKVDPPPVSVKEKTVDTAKKVEPPPPATDNMTIAKKQRILDTISTIVTTEKHITITIFDNGQVDGDTVTIFHNNKVLLSNHFVSATPHKINITLSEAQPRHEIILVANNLGSIPPNTAVLVVEAGEKRYRLNASADMQKSALLVFELRQ